MSTLYIDRRYSELQCSGKALMVRSEHTGPMRIPFALLERVVIHGQVALNSSTLAALADAGIAITIICGRRGNRLAHVLGNPGKDVTRRLQQYQLRQQPDACRQLVRTLLAHKLAATRRQLATIARYRPDLRRHWHSAGQRLQQLRIQLAGEYSLEGMRGIEGAAAACWYGVLRHALPASLGFQGRQRRPPPDPVNAALSLGYTLLFSDAVRILHAHGLDPWLGYLHEPAHGRESLAADLMEPMRLQVDRLVWRLFARQKLTAEHFSRDGAACLLKREGRGLFYASYEKRARAMRVWMRAASGYLLRYLQNREELPQP